MVLRMRKPMSVGRSSEKPVDVQIEISAAEFVKFGLIGGDASIVSRATMKGWHDTVYMSYNMHFRERGMYDAGWLAREIVDQHHAAPEPDFKYKKLKGVILACRLRHLGWTATHATPCSRSKHLAGRLMA